MKKARMYWILAMGMAVFGLGQAVTGFVLWLGFPAGGGGGGRGLGGGGGGGLGNLTFWDLSKHTWIDIHDWIAVALVVMVVVHLALHWKWIARMAKSMFKVTRRSLVPVAVRND